MKAAATHSFTVHYIVSGGHFNHMNSTANASVLFCLLFNQSSTHAVVIVSRALDL